MLIETKFKPGDKVFSLRDRKVISAEVVKINIEITDKDITINYSLSIYIESKSLAANFITINEVYLFASKEDLIKSL